MYACTSAARQVTPGMRIPVIIYTGAIFEQTGFVAMVVKNRRPWYTAYDVGCAIPAVCF